MRGRGRRERGGREGRREREKQERIKEEQGRKERYRAGERGGRKTERTGIEIYIVCIGASYKHDTDTRTSCADHNHLQLPVMYFLNRQKHLFDVYTSQTAACVCKEGQSRRKGESRESRTKREEGGRRKGGGRGERMGV